MDDYLGGHPEFIFEVVMASTSSPQSNPSEKVANVTAIVKTGADVASMAISLIAGMGDAKKRAQFSNNLTLLSEEANKQLQQRLLDANSESERMQILSEYLTDASKARIDNLTLTYKTEEARKRMVILVTGGVIIAIAVIAGFIIYKKT